MSNSTPLAAPVLLEKLYLEIRAKLLEVGASLDRLERADDAELATADPRREQIQKGLEILLTTGDDRAERIQMLFSDQYQPNWSNALPKRKG